MAKVMKQVLYDKTPRINPNTFTLQITEKLDGGNLAFFVLEEDSERTLYIAQRKTIFDLETALSGEVHLYRGLREYLEKYGAELRDTIYLGSVVLGEWIGTGAIKYTGTDINKQFYMFAKARLTEDWGLEKIVYDHKLLHYVFEDGNLPECVSVVPLVELREQPPTIAELDELYAHYADRVGRPVEGFVITSNTGVFGRCKYVRFKNKKLTPHWWNEEVVGEKYPVKMTIYGPLQ